MADWTVYTSWRGDGHEDRETYPSWPAARRAARHYTCLAGVRYVTVQGPDDVVVADYDRYTNRWREYHRRLRRGEPQQPTLPGIH